MTLAESSGAGSVDEIKFLAGLISEYKNISFSGYLNGEKGLMLSATYAEDDIYKNYYLIFAFQYRVKNPAPKSQDWRVDMAVLVYANYPVKEQRIGGMAIEYDGHPRHFVESGIRTQMVRDANILDIAVLNVIRISEDGAKNDPGLYKKAIRKYVRHCMDTHRETVKATTSKLINAGFKLHPDDLEQPQATPSDSTGRFTDCPACKANGYFGPVQCNLCNGSGTLRSSETNRSDIIDFFTIRCLACYPSSSSTKCRHCGGSGSMDNNKALEYAKKNHSD